MTINRERYDGVHFQAETVNLRDGSVEGHAQGCADVKRQAKKHGDEALLWDCLSKRDVYLGYNADFIEESGSEDGHYEIDWKPCAEHIPAEAEVAPVVEADPLAEVTVKAGRIWTYIYRGETLLAEVRTDSAALVIAALSA